MAVNSCAPACKGEKSGGPVSYYLVNVTNPNQGTIPYQAECGDIIEALKMDFNQGCAFKALWRSAAAAALGKLKEGGDALYDAQKVEFYGQRMQSVILGRNVKRPVELEVKLDTSEVAEALDETAKTVANIVKSFDDTEQRILARCSNIRSVVRSLSNGSSLSDAVHAELTGIEKALDDFRSSKPAG